MEQVLRMGRQLGMTAIVLLLAIGTCITLAICVVYFVVPDQYAGFFADRDPAEVRRPFLLLHVGGGAVALVLGIIQMIGLRRRPPPTWHRALGSLYVLSVFASVAGVAAIVAYSFGPPINAVGFGLLGLAWAITTGCGLVCALQGRGAAHRRWMIRSFALTLAAVSLRLQLGILQLHPDISYNLAYSIVAWSSWLPNLLIAQHFINQQRVRQPAEG
jgi:hypothetical protein